MYMRYMYMYMRYMYMHMRYMYIVHAYTLYVHVHALNAYAHALYVHVHALYVHVHGSYFYSLRKSEIWDTGPQIQLFSSFPLLKIFQTLALAYLVHQFVYHCNGIRHISKELIASEAECREASSTVTYGT